MAHFEHGAIDKDTKYLVDPISALKRIFYECPDCKKDVYVRKGPVKIAHFAHRSDKNNPCTFYNRNPSREQKHKNAQLKLKQFLERGKEIDISRKCLCGCGRISNWGITCKGSIVKCEHRFTFNNSNKSADVAVLNKDGSIVCIFEVVNTHYTNEPDRPEPWHEIMADEINAIPSDRDDIVLTCVRQKLRPECLARKDEEHKALLKRLEEERIQREKEEEENRKWREEMNRRYHQQQIQYRIEEEERIRLQRIRDQERQVQYEKEKEEKKRREEEKKAREQKLKQDAEERERERRQLYKKFAIQIPKCYRCKNLISAWLNADEYVGRCETCKKQINALIEKSNTTNKLPVQVVANLLPDVVVSNQTIARLQ